MPSVFKISFVLNNKYSFGNASMELFKFAGCEDAAGRIVGIRQVDQLRAERDRIGDGGKIETPAAHRNCFVYHTAALRQGSHGREGPVTGEDLVVIGEK